MGTCRTSSSGDRTSRAGNSLLENSGSHPYAVRGSAGRNNSNRSFLVVLSLTRCGCRECPHHLLRNRLSLNIHWTPSDVISKTDTGLCASHHCRAAQAATINTWLIREVKVWGERGKNLMLRHPRPSTFAGPGIEPRQSVSRLPVVRLLSHLLHELHAHILLVVSDLDIPGDRHSVVHDLGGPVCTLQHYVPALGPQGHL